MKKNLENFQRILTVSKHFHSEVGFFMLSAWVEVRMPSGEDVDYAQGRGASAACGGVSAARRWGGGNLPPPVLPTLSWGRLVKLNQYQNGQGDCLLWVSQGTVFGKVKHRIWNSEIFYHPPYEKNKLLLNEYLGDFMHFETIFFCGKLHFQTHP